MALANHFGLALCLFSFQAIYAASSAVPRVEVNKRTLNCFVQIGLVKLPCYVPIEIQLSYNSYSGESSIFGKKWTFNQNAYLKRDGLALTVIEGDGFEHRYVVQENLRSASDAEIAQLVKLRMQTDELTGGPADNKVYEDYRKRLAQDQDFRHEQLRSIYQGVPLSAGIYRSFSRGSSTVKKRQDGNYVRAVQARVEEFNTDGLLVRSRDRNGNTLTYTYSGGKLQRIADDCGGFVEFSVDSKSGLITSMVDSSGQRISFEHDTNKCLTAYTIGQRKMQFEYDVIGNLLNWSLNAGQRESFEYNEGGEVVIQTSGTRRMNYKRRFMEGRKDASGTEIEIFQDGRLARREVHDFEYGQKEAFKAYDVQSSLRESEVRLLSPKTGMPLSILKDDGTGQEFEYDSAGRITKQTIVPTGRAVTFVYGEQCEEPALLRIAQPGKAEREFIVSFDNRCNKSEVEERVNGRTRARLRLSYTRGLTEEINAWFPDEEYTLRIEYGPHLKPERVTLVDVGSIQVSYDKELNISRTTTSPHGKGTERWRGVAGAESFIVPQIKAKQDRVFEILHQPGN